jgi:hypothetical protein
LTAASILAHERAAVRANQTEEETRKKEEAPLAGTNPESASPSVVATGEDVWITEPEKDAAGQIEATHPLKQTQRVPQADEAPVSFAVIPDDLPSKPEIPVQPAEEMMQSHATEAVRKLAELVAQMEEKLAEQESRESMLPEIDVSTVVLCHGTHESRGFNQDETLLGVFTESDLPAQGHLDELGLNLEPIVEVILPAHIAMVDSTLGVLVSPELADYIPATVTFFGHHSLDARGHSLNFSDADLPELLRLYGKSGNTSRYLHCLHGDNWRFEAPGMALVMNHGARAEVAKATTVLVPSGTVCSASAGDGAEIVVLAKRATAWDGQGFGEAALSTLPGGTLRFERGANFPGVVKPCGAELALCQYEVNPGQDFDALVPGQAPHIALYTGSEAERFSLHPGTLLELGAGFHGSANLTIPIATRALVHDKALFAGTLPAVLFAKCGAMVICGKSCTVFYEGGADVEIREDFPAESVEGVTIAAKIVAANGAETFLQPGRAYQVSKILERHEPQPDIENPTQPFPINPWAVWVCVSPHGYLSALSDTSDNEAWLTVLQLKTAGQNLSGLEAGTYSTSVQNIFNDMPGRESVLVLTSDAMVEAPLSISTSELTTLSLPQPQATSLAGATGEEPATQPGVGMTSSPSLEDEEKEKEDEDEEKEQDEEADEEQDDDEQDEEPPPRTLSLKEQAQDEAEDVAEVEAEEVEEDDDFWETAPDPLADTASATGAVKGKHEAGHLAPGAKLSSVNVPLVCGPDEILMTPEYVKKFVDQKKPIATEGKTAIFGPFTPSRLTIVVQGKFRIEQGFSGKIRTLPGADGQVMGAANGAMANLSKSSLTLPHGTVTLNGIFNGKIAVNGATYPIGRFGWYESAGGAKSSKGVGNRTFGTVRLRSGAVLPKESFIGAGANIIWEEKNGKLVAPPAAIVVACPGTTVEAGPLSIVFAMDESKVYRKDSTSVVIAAPKAQVIVSDPLRFAGAQRLANFGLGDLYFDEVKLNPSHRDACNIEPRFDFDSSKVWTVDKILLPGEGPPSRAQRLRGSTFIRPDKSTVLFKAKFD